MFPAGHIEPGKTREEALIREMKEELGITIFNPQLVHSDTSDHQEKQRIFWYKCEKFQGGIVNNEAHELIWIKPSEAHKLTFQHSKDAFSAYLKSK